MIPENNWPTLLLLWFDENRRELPWRDEYPRNPYHVWVSEIMLQQTRTEAVKAYFARWIEQFPTITALAQAQEEDVLRAWQGLGYYSRARNLHRAAQTVVLLHGGILPHDRAALRKLPGIGDYTAGAIASLAFGQKVPAVDGNLLRVLARLYAVREDVLSSLGKKKITKLAEKTIPAKRPGAFNEALMDLGADVCIPKTPRCEVCPLRNQCRAFAENLTQVLPLRKKKAPQKVFYAAVGIVVHEGSFLFYRRPERGMLASMWEFPMALSAKGVEEAKAQLEASLQGAAGEILWSHKHVFTHQIWHMTAYRMQGGRPYLGICSYFTPQQWKALPLAGPHAKLAAYVEQQNIK